MMLSLAAGMPNLEPPAAKRNRLRVRPVRRRYARATLTSIT